MENIKDPILQIKDVCISYTSDVMAVKHVSADIEKNTITAIMGPSGCGKSTLLRAVNRMHELYKNIRVTGEILLNGENVLQMHPMEERRRIGMVFQRPNPFPTMNIYDNVLAGYILNGIHLSKSQKDEIVERNLRNVCLWDEVKDSLTKRGTFLSGGQQQRLCIARSLALQPDILLMDEPTSALDPELVGEVLQALKMLAQEGWTMIIVTHELNFAKDVADRVILMENGQVVEQNTAAEFFSHPQQERTKQFLTRIIPELNIDPVI